MFYINQFGEGDCGFTCLKILLANINKDKNYLFIPTPSNLMNKSSFADLKNEANKYDVELHGIKVEEENKDSLYKCDTLPMLLTLVIEGKAHLVYVYKISKKHVFYLDPSLGKVKKKFLEFLSLWNGTGLIIVQFNKNKCPIVKQEYLTLLQKISLPVLQVFSAAFLVLGIYFINKNAEMYLPIIFLSLLIINELVLKKYCLILMNKIDNQITGQLPKNKEDYYDFFVSTNEVKKTYLSSKMNITFSILVICIIVFILLVNNKNNGIYVIIALILSLSNHFIVGPLMKRKEVQIQLEENKIHSIKDNEEYLMINSSINKKAMDYASCYSAWKYLTFGILLIVSIVVMILEKVSSAAYILCYLCLSVYLYQVTNSLFKSEDDIKKCNVNIAKINSIIEKEDSQ